jgi:outer membrane protein OmpA-like peptidoglycan-associated protein
MRTLVILGLIASSPAVAADADIFRPSGSYVDFTGTLQGDYPLVGRPGFSVGLMSWIAEDLVVFAYDDGTEEPILGTAFATNIHGAWTFGDRVRLEAHVPVYPYAEAPLTGFAKAGMGDIELRGLVHLAEASDSFAIAVLPFFALPTGTEDAILDRGFHGGLYAVLGGMLEPSTGWVVNLGLVGAQVDTLENITLGSSVDGVMGVWHELDRGFRVGGDVNFTVGLAREPEMERHSMFTGHLFSQIASNSGFAMTVGGGGGIGVGAPEYRVIAALSYAPLAADADRDGIADEEDACPQEEEDPDRFEDEDGCPDPDNDGDTLPDGGDQCPDEAEDHDGFADLDGCPDSDNDADGVLDVDDRCPDRPGPADMQGCGDPDQDGISDADDQCPEEPGSALAKGCPDADGDLVPDFRDACPDEGIATDADPDLSDGCPGVAYVTDDGQIRILEKVHFDDGSAEVRPDARPVLDGVVAILVAHPELDLVEVAGHTDNRGYPASNQELSERRAEAVALYLVEKGIVSQRLMPKGYGQEEPVDTNRTSAGRANNRRIEFHIRRVLEAEPAGTEETPPPEDAWPPEPAPMEEPAEDVTPRPADEDIWQ